MKKNLIVLLLISIIVTGCGKQPKVIEKEVLVTKTVTKQIIMETHTTEMVCEFLVDPEWDDGQKSDFAYAKEAELREKLGGQLTKVVRGYKDNKLVLEVAYTTHQTYESEFEE